MRAHKYLLTPEETKWPALLRPARLHVSQLAKPRL
jgi:hypothetical protein